MTVVTLACLFFLGVLSVSGLWQYSPLLTMLLFPSFVYTGLCLVASVGYYSLEKSDFDLPVADKTYFSRHRLFSRFIMRELLDC